MNDIFISFAREDRSRVELMAAAFESCGRSVWWDSKIPAGRSFDEVIARELADSRCVVVAWSATSVDSHWVREEAETARARGVLVPVLLDRVAPPLGFGRIQAADLVEWNGDPSAPEFAGLAADVAALLAPTDAALAVPGARPGRSQTPPAHRAAPKSIRNPTRRWAAIGLAIAVVTAAVLGGLYQLQQRGSVNSADGPGRVQPANPPAGPAPIGQGTAAAKADTASLAPTPGPVDLLSAEQGGQLLVADSNYWSQAADGKEDKFNLYAGKAEAVYGFKDRRRATFDAFSVLVEDTDGYNLKDFELLVGDESPTGTFRSLGRFTTQNVKLFETPYQAFSFEPVTARFLKVRLLSSHGESGIAAREFKLWGKPDANP